MGPAGDSQRIYIQGRFRGPTAGWLRSAGDQSAKREQGLSKQRADNHLAADWPIFPQLGARIFWAFLAFWGPVLAPGWGQGSVYTRAFIRLRIRGIVYFILARKIAQQ